MVVRWCWALLPSAVWAGAVVTTQLQSDWPPHTAWLGLLTGYYWDSTTTPHTSYLIPTSLPPHPTSPLPATRGLNLPPNTAPHQSVSWGLESDFLRVILVSWCNYRMQKQCFCYSEEKLPVISLLSLWNSLAGQEWFMSCHLSWVIRH